MANYIGAKQSGSFDIADTNSTGVNVQPYHSSTGAGAGNGCGRTGCAHRRTENLGMSCLGAAGRRDVQP